MRRKFLTACRICFEAYVYLCLPVHSQLQFRCELLNISAVPLKSLLKPEPQNPSTYTQSPPCPTHPKKAAARQPKSLSRPLALLSASYQVLEVGGLYHQRLGISSLGSELSLSVRGYPDVHVSCCCLLSLGCFNVCGIPTRFFIHSHSTPIGLSEAIWQQWLIAPQKPQTTAA